MFQSLKKKLTNHDQIIEVTPKNLKCFSTIVLEHIILNKKDIINAFLQLTKERIIYRESMCKSRLNNVKFYGQWAKTTWGCSDEETIWICQPQMSVWDLSSTLLHEALHYLVTWKGGGPTAQQEHEAIRLLGEI